MKPKEPSRSKAAAEGRLSPIAVALGRIPSGLFVVTWRDGDHDRGMLASWVMQASFAPPAISLAVERSRSLLSRLHDGGSFVLHVLGNDQRGLLTRFTKPVSTDQSPFDGLTTTRTDHGLIVLADVPAALECRSMTSCTAGDHVVVIAMVTSAIIPPALEGSLEPVIHLRRNGLRY